MGYISRNYIKEKYLKLKYDMENFLCVLDDDLPDKIDEENALKAINNVKDNYQSIIEELNKAKL